MVTLVLQDLDKNGDQFVHDGVVESYATRAQSVGNSDSGIWRHQLDNLSNLVSRMMELISNFFGAIVNSVSKLMNRDISQNNSSNDAQNQPVQIWFTD